MKKCLMLFSLVGMLAMPACGDKVADPEALYKAYLKDDKALQAKVNECKLLSVEQQLKSQTCSIALKADGERQTKRHGGVKMTPLDLSK